MVDPTSFDICIFRSDKSLDSIPPVGQADIGSSGLVYVGKGTGKVRMGGGGLMMRQEAQVFHILDPLTRGQYFLPSLSSACVRMCVCAFLCVRARVYTVL